MRWQNCKKKTQYADHGFQVWCWTADLAKTYSGLSNCPPEVFKEQFLKRFN